jgi:hypothetical protein
VGSRRFAVFIRSPPVRRRIGCRSGLIFWCCTTYTGTVPKHPLLCYLHWHCPLTPTPGAKSRWPCHSPISQMLDKPEPVETSM